MGFLVYGISHHVSSIDVRERIAFTPEEIADFYRTLGEEGNVEGVVLSTCNRTEFYGYSRDAAFSPLFFEERIRRFRGSIFQDVRPYFYHHREDAAVRHLYRVASGLDSMVVGENEILGQLREAFRMASAAGAVRTLLARLFEKALKVGKDVRTKTRINEGAVSIPSVALNLAEKIFDLSEEKILLLGTGEMGLQIATGLKRLGADIAFAAGRDEEKTRRFASDFGAKPIRIEEWKEKLSQTDILIASTAAEKPVVLFSDVQEQMQIRKNRPLLMMDLGLPRNIDPLAHSLEDVYLYNLDDLKQAASENIKKRRNEIQAAEALVEDAVLAFGAWLSQLEFRPALELFEKKLRRILDETLEGVDEEKKAKVRARLLSLPMETLKEASRNGEPHRHLYALRDLFRLDDEHPLHNPGNGTP